MTIIIMLNEFLIRAESDPVNSPVVGYFMLEDGCSGWCVDADEGLMMKLVWSAETPGISDSILEENIFKV